MKMNHLKKIISEEIIKYGFDTVGFSNPISLDKRLQKRYKEFISKKLSC